MATYTHGHHESVLRSHRWRTAENSAAYLLPHLRPGMRILDAGCGPGSITLDLARRVGPQGSVVGIDPAADVIAVADKERKDAGLTNVRFEVADVASFAREQFTFDVVHAHQVLQHVGDPVSALRDMRALARDDGLVAARDADYGAMVWSPPSPDLTEWQAMYRQVARQNGACPDAGRELLGWAHAAGFDEVVPSASVWCFANPRDRRWWGGLWADRVTRSALAEQAIAASIASADDLERMAAAWRSWAEEKSGWFTVLNGEILCRTRPDVDAPDI